MASIGVNAVARVKLSHSMCWIIFKCPLCAIQLQTSLKFLKCMVLKRNKLKSLASIFDHFLWVPVETHEHWVVAPRVTQREPIHAVGKSGLDLEEEGAHRVLQRNKRHSRKNEVTMETMDNLTNNRELTCFALAGRTKNDFNRKIT